MEVIVFIDVIFYWFDKNETKPIQDSTKSFIRRFIHNIIFENSNPQNEHTTYKFNTHGHRMNHSHKKRYFSHLPQYLHVTILHYIFTSHYLYIQKTGTHKTVHNWLTCSIHGFNAWINVHHRIHIFHTHAMDSWHISLKLDALQLFKNHDFMVK